MEENEFLQIIDYITQRTGIIPRDSHKMGIKNYLEKRIMELEEEEKTKIDYLKYIQENLNEPIHLLNNATVNETYFFREEAQFELLKSKILPEIVKKNSLIPGRAGRPVKIWSAACSTGEEIVSIFLLAQSIGIKTECSASDINTEVLEECSKGKYKKHSVRSVDGSRFHNLLEKYKQPDNTFEIPEEIRNKINWKRINLSKMEDFPADQDIIFIRNVFIYFSNELKKSILQKIAETSLAPGGYIFVSMNEVASFDRSIIPPTLEKLSDGKIFYFHKKEVKNV